MKFFKANLEKIENQILAIKKTLSDESREREMASGIPMEIFEKKLAKENKPLLAKLDELQLQRNFAQDEMLLNCNIGAMAIAFLAMVISLFVAFLVPPYEQSKKLQHDERAAIQSIYQAIVANGDIFVSNYDSLKQSQSTTTAVSLPESYLEPQVGNDVRNILQKGLGIDLFRFLLDYFSQTELLNEQIQKVRTEMAASGSSSVEQLKSAQTHWSTIASLEDGNWKEAKFNYIYDTECLEYLLRKAFPYIEVRERDKAVTCNDDSLNRIVYQYGYIEAEFPNWLKPEMKAALNNREPGLGGRLIH